MLTQIIKKNTNQAIALTSLIATSLMITTPPVNATIVEFQTSQGNFQVNLFDQTTPITVNNFLAYIEADHYDNTVVHRVVSDFIVQGGGYEFTGEWPLTPLSENSPITNEPIYSNVTGTIAMAKVSGDPDSATDQWFFNLTDNSTNLDLQNDGFTVFGQVIGDGMTVVNKIAALDLCTAGSLSDIPMVLDADQQCSDMTAPGLEDFVVIEDISIIDPSEVTDADLTPTKNTLINTEDDNDTETSDSSGGSLTWFSLTMLTFITARKRLFKKLKTA